MKKYIFACSELPNFDEINRKIIKPIQWAKWYSHTSEKEKDAEREDNKE